LRTAVENVALPQDPAQGRNRVPLQIVMHARNWLGLADENAGAQSFAHRAEASFNSENDTMTLEVRPTESGLRARLEFQGGFVALMGRNFTNNIENGIFARPARRQTNEETQKVEER